MQEQTPLQAPFPWFGGKRRVARVVWSRMGNVPNYVEPFAGSLAVLLARPHPARLETVNDIDCHVANFWRAVTADPAGVAAYADWPVNECDLHARHRWLVDTMIERAARLEADPEYFDLTAAGWWVWGICQWIGGGWCSETVRKKPLLDGPGKGVQRQQKPYLDHHGSGVHATTPLWRQRPHLTAGQGVSRTTLQKRRPSNIAHGIQCVTDKRDNGVLAWMLLLQERLRSVRVCCGDWSRVVTPSVTVHNALTGVFLDPPYAVEAGRDPDIYARDSRGISAAVRAWAIANGDNPRLRIALCGYEGEHQMPDTWECVPWKAQGGYGARGGGPGRENARRERIWFSPHCLRAGLFDPADLQEVA